MIGCVRGTVWNFTSDCLNYVVSTRLSGNVNRLKMLPIDSSTISPNGLVSSSILIRKLMLQKICVSVLYWCYKLPLTSLRFVWNPGPSFINATADQGNSKWPSTSTPICQPGHVRIVDEALPRIKWKSARLISVSIPEDGLVRSALVKVVFANENKLSSTELNRPINKLIRLVSEGPIPRQ